MAISFPTSPNTNDTYTVGNITWTWNGSSWTAAQAGTTYSNTDLETYLNGNWATSIIPDTNAQYDLGSAEYKVRHLYLSSTSMYMGDNEIPIQLSADEKSLAINSVPLKSSGAIDAVNAGAIDVAIANHFITNGETYTLADGTYIGQELKFWRVAGAGYADITVANAIYTNGANTTAQAAAFVWRLGYANVGMYNCIWNGTAWVLSSGQAAV